MVRAKRSKEEAAPSTSCIIIGDMHAPYTDVAAMSACLEAVEREKPTYVIQMGDLYDQYAFSKYARNPNHTTPREEMDTAKVFADVFWRNIRHNSPKSKCYQLLGNHDVRLDKRIAERLPELTGLLSLRHYFKFDGVETQESDRDILELTINSEPVVFHHGWLSKPGDHVKYFGRSTVIGHSHSPHVLYHRHHRGALFELNVGYVGDPAAHVFSYAGAMNKWTRAYGTIDKYGPRVVALEK